MRSSLGTQERSPGPDREHSNKHAAVLPQDDMSPCLGQGHYGDSWKV